MPMMVMEQINIRIHSIYVILYRVFTKEIKHDKTYTFMTHVNGMYVTKSVGTPGERKVKV